MAIVIRGSSMIFTMGIIMRAGGHATVTEISLFVDVEAGGNEKKKWKDWNLLFTQTFAQKIWRCTGWLTNSPEIRNMKSANKNPPHPWSPSLPQFLRSQEILHVFSSTCSNVTVPVQLGAPSSAPPQGFPLGPTLHSALMGKDMLVIQILLLLVNRVGIK